MTVEEAEKRLSEVDNIAGDPEAAHEAEDRLRHDVLVAIALGASDAKRLAETALRTSNLEFPRWFA